LARAFRQADGLNREALRRLGQGEALGALAPLFAEKAALEARWEGLLALLGGPSGAAENADGLGEALAAQAAAARSEAQLSEALSLLVSSDGKIKSAYQQKDQPKPGKAWDGAG
jgi:hypothetical protein